MLEVTLSAVCIDFCFGFVVTVGICDSADFCCFYCLIAPH